MSLEGWSLILREVLGSGVQQYCLDFIMYFGETGFFKELVNSLKFVGDLIVQYGIVLWLIYYREEIFKLQNMYFRVYINIFKGIQGMDV